MIREFNEGWARDNFTPARGRERHLSVARHLVTKFAHIFQKYERAFARSDVAKKSDASGELWEESRGNLKSTNIHGIQQTLFLLLLVPTDSSLRFFLCNIEVSSHLSPSLFSSYLFPRRIFRDPKLILKTIVRGSHEIFLSYLHRKGCRLNLELVNSGVISEIKFNLSIINASLQIEIWSSN